MKAVSFAIRALHCAFLGVRKHLVAVDADRDSLVNVGWKLHGPVAVFVKV